MNRYLPARHYLSFGIVALGLTVFSGWLGMSWAPGFIPAGLFLLTAALLIGLAYRPAIEVYPHHIAVGSRVIHWMDIRRVDRTRWISPLVVRLTLFDDTRVTLVYPGDLDSCHGLLRQVRRASRDALIDGVPYRQYWGEVLASDGKGRPAPRYRLLRPEDEAEVERLYQRLKTVGNLDPKSSDEK
jgi:hypothetical protein